MIRFDMCDVLLLKNIFYYQDNKPPFIFDSISYFCFKLPLNEMHLNAIHITYYFIIPNLTGRQNRKIDFDTSGACIIIPTQQV